MKILKYPWQQDIGFVTLLIVPFHKMFQILNGVGCKMQFHQFCPCTIIFLQKTRVYPIFINESGHPFVILNNSQWTEISNKSHNDSALGLVPLQGTSYPVTMNQQVTQVPTQSQQIMHHHFMTNQQQPLTQQQPMTQQQQPLTQQQQLQLAPQQFAQPQYHLTQQQYAALQQHQTMVQQQPGHTYAPTLYQQTPQLQTSVDSSNERPPSYKT